MTATRVAVVGAGWWGNEHARAVTAHPDAELCAVAGRTAERTGARAAQYGVPAYTDLARMLAEQSPDLVSVCLPNLEHYAPTMQLLEAGVPLLVEKPLVFDLAEADRLLAEAERTSTFFAITFNHRYARPVQLALDAVRTGRLGEPVFATWRFGGEGSSAHHPHANLIETQCHGFDLLEHLCGPIASLSAHVTGGTHALSLTFANGAIGSLLGTYDSSYAYRGAHLLEINGTKGHLLVEDTVKRFTFQAAGNETAEVWEPGWFNRRDRDIYRTIDLLLDDVLGALRRGDPPPVPASAGRRALQLAWAAVESAVSGRRVEVAL